MANITIENTEPRFISLCDAPLKPGADLPDVLNPGLNEVDASVWAKVKSVRAVAALVQAGVLREAVAAPVAPVEPLLPPGGPSLPDMKATDAIALVQMVTDKATLEAWFAEETRTTVLAAIEAQLATLGG